MVRLDRRLLFDDRYGASAAPIGYRSGDASTLR